jgi:signal transduction histidine kinase
MTEASSLPLSPDASLATRLERLVTGGPELIAELSLEGVLQTVADLAAEVIGARYAAVGLLAADGRTLESFTTHGMTAEERNRIPHLPRGLGILGLVIHDSQSLRIADLSTDPRRSGFPPNHPAMRSFLGVPVVGQRGVLGDLYLTEKIPGPGGAEFTEQDEHLATLLASKAAAAIENARLHEQSARLLEEVQQLHRSRERFFAMVNHELRNSLAAVYGWAEMLVRRKDPQSVPRAAYEVLDSAEGAISLINDLLDLSRLDEDRLRPNILEVDCNSVVRQAMNRVTPAAETKGVRITSAMPDPGPVCRTDPSRVEQILMNLLGNAIKHSPAGCSVKATLRQDPTIISLMIEDEGPGIAVGDVDRIFDVYETKAVEEGQGTGLGLPLSRRLARLLGGELKAVARPGVGGCFILELPIATS